MENTGNINIT